MMVVLSWLVEFLVPSIFITLKIELKLLNVVATIKSDELFDSNNPVVHILPIHW